MIAVSRWNCSLLMLVLSMTLHVRDARAQSVHNDSAIRPAGAEYSAHGLKRTVLGRGYRDLWTTPFDAPLLDLDSTGHELRAVRRLADVATPTLLLRDEHGAEYYFRIIDEVSRLAQEPELRRTIVGGIIQDRVSALHPAGRVIGASLEESAGVLHTHPHMFVMPDSPLLGEFRQEFAGRLGDLEERADFFATDSVLARVDALHEVDIDAYLRLRLMDLFLNNWDRRADQTFWRQAAVNGHLLWQPIATDLGYALSDYRGWLSDALRFAVPSAHTFGRRIADVTTLSERARQLDVTLLGELPDSVWEDVASDLQSRLTDAALDSALSQMPPEMRARSSTRLRSILASRRASIPDAARRLRHVVAHVRANPLSSLQAHRDLADPLYRLLPNDSVAPPGGCRSCGSTQRAGLVIAPKFSITKRDSEHELYAYKLSVRPMIGLGSLTFAAAPLDRLGLNSLNAGTRGLGVEVRAERFKPHSHSGFGMTLLASRVETLRLLGLGNEIPGDVARTRYVPAHRIVAEAHVRFALADSVTVAVGPIFKYTRTSAALAGNPFQEMLAHDNGIEQLGAGWELVANHRGAGLFPRSGSLVTAGMTAYPLASNERNAFAEIHGVATRYVPWPQLLQSVIALRAGGQMVLGDAPVHELAFLGGQDDLRGYAVHTFAGNSALFGNAELRSRVTEVNFLMRGQIGTLLLADIGRVFLDGESSGTWHHAWGGGLWYGVRVYEHDLSASVVLAHGSGNRMYARVGAPF